MFVSSIIGGALLGTGTFMARLAAAFGVSALMGLVIPSLIAGGIVIWAINSGLVKNVKVPI